MDIGKEVRVIEVEPEPLLQPVEEALAAPAHTSTKDEKVDSP